MEQKIRADLVDLLELEIVGVAETGEILLVSARHRRRRGHDRVRSLRSRVLDHRLLDVISCIERAGRIVLDQLGGRLDSSIRTRGDHGACGRKGAQIGELARGIGDEVLQNVGVLVAHILAIVLELANRIDDRLLIRVRAVENARRLVARILHGLGGISIRLRHNLVGRALRDDESLGDGAVVSLLLLKLSLEVGDDLVFFGEKRVFLGNGGIAGERIGSQSLRLIVHRGDSGIETVETGTVELILESGDMIVENVDLVGNVLEEDVDLVDVIALAVD